VTEESKSRGNFFSHFGSTHKATDLNTTFTSRKKKLNQTPSLIMGKRLKSPEEPLSFLGEDETQDGAKEKKHKKSKILGVQDNGRGKEASRKTTNRKGKGKTRETCFTVRRVLKDAGNGTETEKSPR